MSINDQRSIVQLQDLKTPLQINEALRKLNASINKLEGRQGQILLRDGFSSLSSTATASQWAAELFPDSDFGIFFTGVNGTDCWLASGARLAPSNEWIATKTRATMIKFDNIFGIQTYLNTGLTIEASFIPLLQSSTTSAPVWGDWSASFSGPGNVTWGTETHTDAAYFLRQAGNTEIKILTTGIYQLYTSIYTEGSDVDGPGILWRSQIFMNVNGGSVSQGAITTIPYALPAGFTVPEFSLVDGTTQQLVVGDLVTVSNVNSGNTVAGKLVINLLRT